MDRVMEVYEDVMFKLNNDERNFEVDLYGLSEIDKDVLMALITDKGYVTDYVDGDDYLTVTDVDSE